MGKIILIAVAACVALSLFVSLLIFLIKRHGISVPKGRKRTRQEMIGYNPSKVSRTAAACALGCFVCGIMVAMTPFTRDDY